MNNYIIVFKNNDTGKLQNVSGTMDQLEVKFPKLFKHGSFTDLVLSVYDLTNKQYVFKRRSKDLKANVLNSISQPPTVHNRDVGLGPYA